MWYAPVLQVLINHEGAAQVVYQNKNHECLPHKPWGKPWLVFWKMYGQIHTICTCIQIPMNYFGSCGITCDIHMQCRDCTWPIARLAVWSLSNRSIPASVNPPPICHCMHFVLYNTVWYCVLCLLCLLCVGGNRLWRKTTCWWSSRTWGRWGTVAEV